MDHSDLELALAVKQHGSLIQAARALQLTPPVVTKRLAALEGSLGVRLFQRTTRRVSPTAEGIAFCDHAAQLLLGFAALEDELRERQSKPSGVIRIACSFGFGRLWLGPLLAEFHALHPAVRVDLQLSERLPDLANEGFDAAIWLWHPPAHIAADWVSRKLASNQRVLVASPRYLESHGTPRSLDELTSHDCLVVRENGGDTGQGQRFDHWKLSQRSPSRTSTRLLHIAVQGPLSSNSGEMVRDWCLSGRGIMLRSLWDIAPQLAAGALVPVLPDYAMYDADVHWLAPYRARPPLRIRLLQEFLEIRFSEEPWKNIKSNQTSTY